MVIVRHNSASPEPASHKAFSHRHILDGSTILDSDRRSRQFLVILETAVGNRQVLNDRASIQAKEHRRRQVEPVYGMTLAIENHVKARPARINRHFPIHEVHRIFSHDNVLRKFDIDRVVQCIPFKAGHRHFVRVLTKEKRIVLVEPIGYKYRVPAVTRPDFPIVLRPTRGIEEGYHRIALQFRSRFLEVRKGGCVVSDTERSDIGKRSIIKHGFLLSYISCITDNSPNSIPLHFGCGAINIVKIPQQIIRYTSNPASTACATRQLAFRLDPPVIIGIGYPRHIGVANKTADMQGIRTRRRIRRNTRHVTIVKRLLQRKAVIYRWAGPIAHPSYNSPH